MIEPVGGIALLTLVFSFAFRTPPLGDSFPLFYATGFLPFLMYQDVAQKLTTTLRFSKPLLFYPRVTFADALIARFLLGSLMQLAVSGVIILGILATFRIGTFVDLPEIALAYAMAASLGLGVGTLNCCLTSLFPLWERVWAIANRPLFLVSTIFFLFETVPPAYRAWLWFNPLAHVIGQMRKGFYPMYAGAFVSPLYVFGMASVMLAAGLMLLRRHHSAILND